MSGVWFKPTKSAASCYYQVAAPDLAPAGANWWVQDAHSACGTWKTRINLRPDKDQQRPIPAEWEKPMNGGTGTKPLAPDFEICAKCAAVLEITPRPQKPHVVQFSLLSVKDRTPIEEMPSPAPSPPDPPNELEGVDLSEL